MIPFFFQSNHRQLFAMYHRARGRDQAAVRAAVICSPIGQEYVRTHWCLRLLAGQLARRGVHVLRFDYSGQGDSSGAIDEVQSVATWQQDIVSAIEVLQQQSGASSVMLAGLRTGASLAAAVAPKSDQVNSLLLWEPTHQGCEFLAEQRRLHSDMLDLWICKMKTEDSLAAEEILGSRYSRSLLDSLEQLEIEWEPIEQPHVVFDLKNQESLYAANKSPMRKVEFTDDEQSWSDLRQLETAWLRPQTSRRMVDQVVDTFVRLEKFGVLKPNEGVMV